MREDFCLLRSGFWGHLIRRIVNQLSCPLSPKQFEKLDFPSWESVRYIWDTPTLKIHFSKKQKIGLNKVVIFTLLLNSLALKPRNFDISELRRLQELAAETIARSQVGWLYEVPLRFPLRNNTEWKNVLSLHLNPEPFSEFPVLSGVRFSFWLRWALLVALFSPVAYRFIHLLLNFLRGFMRLWQ